MTQTQSRRLYSLVLRAGSFLSPVTADGWRHVEGGKPSTLAKSERGALEALVEAGDLAREILSEESLKKTA